MCPSSRWHPAWSRIRGIGSSNLGRFGLAPPRESNKLVCPGSHLSASAPTAPVMIGLSSGIRLRLRFCGFVANRPNLGLHQTILLFGLLPAHLLAFVIHLRVYPTTFVGSPPLPWREYPGHGHTIVAVWGGGSEHNTNLGFMTVYFKQSIQLLANTIPN